MKFFLVLCFFLVQGQQVLAQKKGYLLSPTLSFLLPGFDQWAEGQYVDAALYTGLALTGLLIASQDFDYVMDQRELGADIESRDDKMRNYFVGNMMYISAGSFSAYHSFRTAVKSRQPYGEFEFIKNDDTVGDLLKAPFEFHFLKRPTTYIPLAVLAVLTIDQVSKHKSHNSYNGRDFFYGSAYSYAAGTNEEAAFRGYMMPVLYETTGNYYYANGLNALVFGAAHISADNPTPWGQALAGYYFGYLTAKNNWSIRESIFLHTWWDVLVFAAMFHEESARPTGTGFSMPLFSGTF
jgi:hypothetical protein